jgi:hypothetical protein
MIITYRDTSIATYWLSKRQPNIYPRKPPDIAVKLRIAHHYNKLKNPKTGRPMNQNVASVKRSGGQI